MFAVNNEAGGYNLLLINKSESTVRDLSLKVAGASAGRYTAYRNNPAAPYDDRGRRSAGHAAAPRCCWSCPR